ncbi:anhydro-N-acetylmuramic acid kinase [Endozoicomonas sp. SM1973]|uniref:Anhydro-N-acetylmuramic acid kinase n=1 Tax=Spartinivicinus marinus TaxID=2994442 RepID=A0A853IE44_9GAMM|nr:anhydro-N-acetylmuramic acid kinase [Spartinivicinus marinus]MCX4028050.1 anhydro-N-acetylmuramic acid kinase [Spartinivicinus marinus]NYZ68324.1 anhydro-N-acetylmuramic acid kinase [Spartinivicinus marinus]
MTALKPHYYLGLMSGTSMDAVDAALVCFEPEFKLIATHNIEISDQLKQQITLLADNSNISVNSLAQIDLELGLLFAQACKQLINKYDISYEEIVAIGSHGQTIRHYPERGFTWQIGDPNIIAEKTGITTVADFRRRDLAAGGEGAPLVPAFHASVFRSSQVNRVIANLGGIANITILPKDNTLPVTGFDTGPANSLCDLWIKKHLDQAFDQAGSWAAKGNIDTSLLNLLLSDKYFLQPPPKSTGRELFNLNWLEQHLQKIPNILPVDVQTTLVELTAISLTQAIKSHGFKAGELYLCGGGAFNEQLTCRIKQHLDSYQVTTTEKLGLNPAWVEAAAFAWLAKQTLAHLPGNLPSVTNASGARILGAIYPGTVI